MCGIAGIFNLNQKRVEPALLVRMIERIRHRGPDDWGIFTDKQVGLAHARLSIIDLASGQQPMHNEDKSLSIVFNGEIFNYIELRQDLLRRGHKLRTQSDTEVILHLYEDEGAECVRHLNGQWAFAIWDSKNETLFLSRDRLGVRPLFYTVADRAFLFGSEIKSIFALSHVSREIDLLALDQLFTVWVTIPPRPIFKGILQLLPGHSLTVRQGKIAVQRYWMLHYGARLESGVTQEQCPTALLYLLVDATRIRLRSDVPVGAYLSGGLDSTGGTTLIKKCTDTPLRTFSVTFAGPELDESSYQQGVRRVLGP